MGSFGIVTLAPVASTGNNTHASQQINPDAESLCLVFTVEAVGATPTVTFKFQGSVEDETVSDANSSWFDVPYVVAANETVAVATQVVTAVGNSPSWLVGGISNKFFRKYRLVTTANTNVTYSSKVVSQDEE